MEQIAPVGIKKTTGEQDIYLSHCLLDVIVRIEDVTVRFEDSVFIMAQLLVQESAVAETCIRGPTAVVARLQHLGHLLPAS